MRVLMLSLLVLAGGCQGHLADHVGPREGIVTPQLLRYGFGLVETRCVSEHLTARLTPLQLRLFARAAGAVRQGYFDPERLSVRDLLHVSSAMGDEGVHQALLAANAQCGVVAEKPVEVPMVAIPPEAPRPPTWLNLGAAESGQSIAIDATTILEDGNQRMAWFRLTDPGVKARPDSFLLAIDCAKKTINSKERKKLNADGSVAERREYPDNPLPVETGTVMQIAWLSLCT